nr:MAG TPA: hypothetical protein [Caudoviricetes sp.]
MKDLGTHLECLFYYVNNYKTNYQKSIDILIYYVIINIS